MLKMGSLVEKQIHEAVHYLSTQNLAGAQSVLEKDDIVDEMQIDIEERCMRLIALQAAFGLRLTNCSGNLSDHHRCGKNWR